MFTKQFKVKGEDVNDFMLMKSEAYVKYSSILIELFFKQKCFSKTNRVSDQIGLQKTNDNLHQYKPIFFTQQFTISLNLTILQKDKNKIKVDFYFYNIENQLFATLSKEIYWFDYNSWKIVELPKSMSNFFLNSNVMKQVS